MFRALFDHYLAPSPARARILQEDRQHTNEVNARPAMVKMIRLLRELGPVKIGNWFEVDGQPVQLLEKYCDGLIVMARLSSGQCVPSSELSYKAAIGEWPRAAVSPTMLKETHVCP